MNDLGKELPSCFLTLNSSQTTNFPQHRQFKTSYAIRRLQHQQTLLHQATTRQDRPDPPALNLYETLRQPEIPRRTAIDDNFTGAEIKPIHFQQFCQDLD